MERFVYSMRWRRAAAVLAVVACALASAGLAAAAFPADAAPRLVEVDPPGGATGVSIHAIPQVTFDEPVSLPAEAVVLACERSGPHPVDIQEGPTHFGLKPRALFLPAETCLLRLKSEWISDLDTDDPPDTLQADVTLAFTTAAAPAEQLLINEVDARTAPGGAEFIELFDGGAGNTPLDGLTLALYDGTTGTVYGSFDLDGYRTDAAGYFLAGTAGAGIDLPFATGLLLDSAAAIGLYAADASSLPRGAPVQTDRLIDALVYGQNASPPLLSLLAEEQPALDEAAGGDPERDSLGRCPNGSGNRRETTSFTTALPTPRDANACTHDIAPGVVQTQPAPATTGVPLNTRITITFTEAVKLDARPLALVCERSGTHDYTTQSGQAIYSFVLQTPFDPSEKCGAVLHSEAVHDQDGDDPPDSPAADLTWEFETQAAVAGWMLINEVDSDTPGADAAEFIELYDGGAGGTALDGLVIVLYNGNGDKSYQTIDLQGKKTDAAGYFVLGNAGVPGSDMVLANAALQNGPDAVALYAGEASAFPPGTPVTAAGLIDALVYGPAATPDAGLLPLLLANEPQVDEAGRGERDAHSSQRCPNAAGGQRRTSAYRQNTPTPGTPNVCPVDAAPAVAAVGPADGSDGVTLDSSLVITFTEPVALSTGWLTLECDRSGVHSFSTTGGPAVFFALPSPPLDHSESCRATVSAAKVGDLDADDPPDHLAADRHWSFSTAAEPARGIILNELDSDTAGSDTLEFVELYDGGRGGTELSGLALVLYNGSADASYRAIDLAGQKTDASGYFVLGNAAVTGVDLVVADGAIQNGPDAVALYAAPAADFPNGTAVNTGDLLDALVYGDEQDEGLLALVEAGQPQPDEGSRGHADVHSLGRCPNGAGGQRHTAGFLANAPSPGAVNNCLLDAAPVVASVAPVNGATDVALAGALTVEFSEPVTVSAGWLALVCDLSGSRQLGTAGEGLRFTVQPPATFVPGEKCRATVRSEAIRDSDADDPPDALEEDFTWGFSIEPVVATGILINEIDPNTPGTDKAEFVELYDGGGGNVVLSGLVLVFYNGSDDRSYHVLDLSGLKTDAAGYLLVGNPALAAVSASFPNGALQNGPDAVALYAAPAAAFPNGTAVRTNDLIDAVVYGAERDAGLLPLLEAEQAQPDEGSRGSADVHSLGRCPNGAGGPRRTGVFLAATPSPGAANICESDIAPRIVSVSPADGAASVPTGSVLSIEFSEPVKVSAGWLALGCSTSGVLELGAAGEGSRVDVNPGRPFAAGETCEATVKALSVHDSDADDPPDTPDADYVWQFTTAMTVTTGIVINEIDPNTPGPDKAEFVELYDGGRGTVALSGLVLVFYNGKDDRSYFAMDLGQLATDNAGYRVVGNPAVAEEGATFPNGALQNGPDAIALYAGRAAGFSAGTAVTLDGLIDAVVYGSGATDPGLLPLLEAGQPPVDEASASDVERHSLGRCPDGGTPLQTRTYQTAEPSPGQPNVCRYDAAPAVTATRPISGALSVPLDRSFVVTFTEPVTATADWLALACKNGGERVLEEGVGASANILTARPADPLEPEDACTLTVRAAAVHDVDPDDPPDTLPADQAWSFTTASLPPPLIAVFTATSPVWVGQPTLFRNASSGPPGLRFRWDFGDGSPSATDVHPAHRFPAPGVYSVTLTAIAGEAQDVAMARVVVLPRKVYLPIVRAP